MSATDTVQIIAPGLTALAGAYYGARFQAGREADAELRGVVDDATTELENLAEATANARSRFLTEGATRTTKEGGRVLGALEVQVAKNRAFRDRILIRVEPASPVYVHYLNMLLAHGRESAEFRTAALMPNDQGEHFDMGKAWKRVEKAEADFERERADYLRAAQALVGRRPGVLRRVLNKAKRSEPSPPDDPGPNSPAVITDAR